MLPGALALTVVAYLHTGTQSDQSTKPFKIAILLTPDSKWMETGRLTDFQLQINMLIISKSLN
jgi:hypothetical protein